jgi:hypothetical protein
LVTYTSMPAASHSCGRDAGVSPVCCGAAANFYKTDITCSNGARACLVTSRNERSISSVRRSCDALRATPSTNSPCLRRQHDVCASVVCARVV